LLALIDHRIPFLSFVSYFTSIGKYFLLSLFMDCNWYKYSHKVSFNFWTSINIGFIELIINFITYLISLPNSKKINFEK